MSQVLEKEVRGAIELNQVERIDKYAKEHQWRAHKYKQISIYCNTDHINSIGSVFDGNARIVIDIRDESLKIKVKVGNALAFERKEYTIKCSKDSAEAIAVLFQLVGIEEGYIRTFDRTDYTTDDGLQFTIKLNCNMGDHFELERNSDSKKEIESFNTIIDELQLTLWTKDELADAIRRDHETIKANNILNSLKGMI